MLDRSSVKIAPSLLSADFSRLGEEVNAVEQAGADAIHVDVMDGHFVPNLTIGPCVVKSLRGCTKLPLDVHLMIEHPERYIEEFANCGADIITVHAEACVHLDRVVSLIKSLGKKAGVALVPSSPIHCLDYVLDKIDLVLVMSVNPGFGGQSLLPSQIDKIAQLAPRLAQASQEIILEVDGGITAQTAPLAIEAGANMLVAGSAVFNAGADQYAANISRLRG